VTSGGGDSWCDFPPRLWEGGRVMAISMRYQCDLCKCLPLLASLVPIRCRECGPPDRRRFKTQDRILPTTSGAIGRQNHQSSHNATLCNIIGIFSPTSKSRGYRGLVGWSATRPIKKNLTYEIFSAKGPKRTQRLLRYLP
jgi:hypothetical protein